MYQRIAVASLAGLVASGCYGSRNVATSPGQSVVEPVVAETFVVEPRSYKQFKIIVADGASKPQLVGTFSASGANNDIEVLLLEETQFLNWQNRHKFAAAYESGRVTADKIKLDLPPEPATYFIVFSNRFSLLSRKSVLADVSLRRDRSGKGH